MRQVPTYHEEVMNSKHHFIAVRCTRRSGKSTLAVRWATKQLGVTLFIAPTQPQASIIREMLVRDIGEAAIHTLQRNKIVTHDGRVYHIIHGTQRIETTMGLRLDNIVIDEFGYIDRSWYNQIGMFKAMNSELKVLMLTSSIRSSSISEAIEEIEPEMHYVSYNINDAIADNLFYREDIEAIYAEQKYKEEFGPWDGFWGEISNEEFTYLLTSE